jgi:hypothetical protein
MRRSTKFLIGYFLFFIGLSAIAMAPGGALVVLLITGMALPLFGLPGLVVIAAPTSLFIPQRCCRSGFRSGCHASDWCWRQRRWSFRQPSRSVRALSRAKRRGCSRRKWARTT